MTTHLHVALHQKVTNELAFSQPQTKRRLEGEMDADIPAKKQRLDSSDAYVPVQEGSGNGDGTSNYSLIFSLKEKKGELLKSLQPFQVIKQI